MWGTVHAVWGHRERRVAVSDNPSRPVTLPRPPRHHLRSPPPRCPRGIAGRVPSVPPPLSHHDSQLLQMGHDPEGSKPKVLQYIRSCYTSSRIGACTCAHTTHVHTQHMYTHMCTQHMRTQHMRTQHMRTHNTCTHTTHVHTHVHTTHAHTTHAHTQHMYTQHMYKHNTCTHTCMHTHTHTHICTHMRTHIHLAIDFSDSLILHREAVDLNSIVG